MADTNIGPIHTRWYDGFIYSKLVTPLQGKIISIIDELVPSDSTVIDIGCGPGALVLKLSAKCKSVVGLDKSAKMIAYASKQKEKIGANNVRFICEDAARKGILSGEHFSLAIICMCLHGMTHKERYSVIENCFTLTTKVIITDYLSQFPRNIVGIAQNLIEAVEGKESYKNFKEWQLHGGIDGFIKQIELYIEKERLWDDRFGKTILAGRKRKREG